MLLKRGSIPYVFRMILTVAVAHLVGSVFIKTLGLAAFYSIPVWALMLWRLLNYLLVGSVEGILLFFMMKNKLLTRQLSTENTADERK
jgi:hypothetical protein